MHLLEQYSQHLKDGDAKKLAALFTEDAVFNDYAPTALDQPPISLKGRKEIEALFEALLANGGLNVINVGVNGNAMRYDIDLGGMVMLALGVMETKGDLIKEYNVTAV